MFDIQQYSTAIFILYLIIAGNFLGELLGCKIQMLFTQNIYIKHLLGFMTLYFFVVFSENGNSPFVDIKRSLLLYLFFLITTKTHYYFIIPILIGLLIIFIMDKQQKYLSFGDGKYTNALYIDKLKSFNSIITYITMLLSCIGFIIYYNKKRNEYKKNWSNVMFLLGKTSCKFDKNT
jgi:hypothetical protein